MKIKPGDIVYCIKNKFDKNQNIIYNTDYFYRVQDIFYDYTGDIIIYILTEKTKYDNLPFYIHSNYIYKNLYPSSFYNDISHNEFFEYFNILSEIRKLKLKKIKLC